MQYCQEKSSTAKLDQNLIQSCDSTVALPLQQWCLPGAPRRQSLCSQSARPSLLGSSTHLISISIEKLQGEKGILFTLIELEVTELAEKPFHHAIDVLLESVHLSRPVVLLQVLHNLLHVVLEVGHVVILLGKSCLNQPEINKGLKMPQQVYSSAHLWFRTRSTPDSEASSVPSSISSAEALLPSSCTSPIFLHSC